MALDFNKLKDNCVVLTGFQFIEQSPLGFFEFDDLGEKVEVFQDKIEGFEAKGKLVVKNDGFNPVKIANGENTANKDIFVVTRAKSRHVLVFQDIDFSKQYHENVFVIPIQTLKKPQKTQHMKEQDYLKRLKEYNDIVNRSKDAYDIFYIPKTKPDGTIIDRILVLSDARFVHRSSLYGAVRENEVNPSEIEEIGIRLSKMFNINKLEKCDECIYNYEKYKDIIVPDVAVDENEAG